ncbi:MAG: flagellar hook-length control protein FliK [Bacteroidetes bacterium]|nr:flagellar hook-length control protein FliK [Bacteroidota bacterium]
MIFNPLFINNSSQTSGAQAYKFANQNYLFADIINVNENGPAIGTTKIADFLNSYADSAENSNNYVISTKKNGNNGELDGQGFKLNEKEITGVLSELIQNSDSIAIINNNTIVTEFENIGDNFLGILQNIFSEMDSNDNIQLQVKNGNATFLVELLNLNQSNNSFNSLSGFSDPNFLKLKNNENGSIKYPESLTNSIKKTLQYTARINKILDFIKSDVTALSEEFTGLIESYTNEETSTGSLTEETFSNFFETDNPDKDELINKMLDNMSEELLNQLFMIYSQNQIYISWTEQSAGKENLTASSNVTPGNIKELKELMQNKGIELKQLFPSVNDFMEHFDETVITDQVLQDDEIFQFVKEKIGSIGETDKVMSQSMPVTENTGGISPNDKTAVNSSKLSQIDGKIGNVINLSSLKNSHQAKEKFEEKAEIPQSKTEKFLLKISQPDHSRLTELITKGTGEAKADDVIKQLLCKIKTSQPDQSKLSDLISKGTGETKADDVIKQLSGKIKISQPDQLKLTDLISKGTGEAKADDVIKQLSGKMKISQPDQLKLTDIISKGTGEAKADDVLKQLSGTKTTQIENKPDEIIESSVDRKTNTNFEIFKELSQIRSAGRELKGELNKNLNSSAQLKSELSAKSENIPNPHNEVELEKFDLMSTIKLNLAKTKNIYALEPEKNIESKTQIIGPSDNIKINSKSTEPAEIKINSFDQNKIINADATSGAKAETNNTPNNNNKTDQNSGSPNNNFANVSSSDKPVNNIAQTFTSELNTMTGNTHEIEKRIEVIKQVELNKINNELKSIITDKGNQNVTLKLTPDSLGKVHITIEVIKDIVNAHIEVENESVRQVVNAGVENLKQTLVQSGMVPQNINISLANSDEKNQKFTKNKKRNSNGENFEMEQNSEIDLPKKMGYNTYDFVA